MAHIFVRGEQGVTGAVGNDTTGDGTPSNPYATLAKAVAVALAGDTVVIDGVFHERSTTWTQANLTVKAWDASRPPQVRGDEDIGDRGWTDSGSGYFTKNIGAGLTLYGVTVNYGRYGASTLRVLGDGDYYGHLHGQSTAAAAQAASQRYHYDSGTGLLTIRLLADADPSDKVLTACKAGHGMVFNGANPTVAGLEFCLFMETGAGNGYGVLVNNTASGGAIDNCRFFDCGYHCAGFRSSPAASAVNCVIRNCLGYGLAGGTSGDRPTLWVFYGAGASNTVSGCVGSNLTGKCRLPLMEDGASQVPLFNATLSNAANDIGGAHTHTDGSATVTDVLYDRCTFAYDASGARGNPITGANATSAPSDPEIWKTYAVRYDRITVTGGQSLLFTQDGSYIGVRHLHAALPNAATDIHTAGIKLNSTRFLMDGCVVLQDGGGATFPRQIYRFGGTSNAARFLNCSLVDYGANAGNTRFAMVLHSSDTLVMRQVLVWWSVDSKTNGWLFNGPAAGSMTFQDCWFPLDARVGANNWSTDTTINTKAEFAAVYTTCVYNTDPQITAAANAEPSAGGAARTGTFTVRRRHVGINRRPGNGTVGAYQYGAAGASLDLGVSLATA